MIQSTKFQVVIDENHPPVESFHGITVCVRLCMTYSSCTVCVPIVPPSAPVRINHPPVDTIPVLMRTSSEFRVRSKNLDKSL